MLFPVFSHTTILPLIREERPYHGDYHNGYHEADDDKTGAALDEVHEGILARAKNESIRRSTYRTCESTGGCDKNRHENSPRGRADLGCQSDAHRAEECFGSGIAHELRQDNGQDEKHRGDDIGRRISAESRHCIFRNEFARAGGIHSARQRNHTGEEEDGNPVNGIIGLAFGKAAGDDTEKSADNRRDLQRYDACSHGNNYAEHDYAADDFLCFGCFISFNFLFHFIHIEIIGICLIKYILADEPTGNLDKENRRKIVELLQQIAHEQDRCVIVVTHSDYVKKKCDICYEMGDDDEE